MLRRGYNFTDGTDGLGRLDAGLFFLAFVRDPARQFVPMQTRLAQEDGLMEYLEPHRLGTVRRPPRGATGWLGRRDPAGLSRQVPGGPFRDSPRGGGGP